MTAKFFMVLSHTETADEVPDESIKTEKKNKNGRKRQRQAKNLNLKKQGKIQMNLISNMLEPYIPTIFR
jgi:hypothetical protein